MSGNLDGAHDVPLLPFNAAYAGVDLGQAYVLASGGNAFYVRGNGTTTTEYAYDPPGVRERLSASINKALSYCVSGRGDVVQVLEGHAETIGNDGNAWSNLVAGTKIIFRGNGVSRGTITFNHANAQIDVAVANVLIYNGRFLCAGALDSTTALSVANPFNVTGAGFQFIKNWCNVGVDADQLTTDCIKLSSAADDAIIANNVIQGQSGAAIATVVKTTGAVDRLSIVGNVVTADVATAATGVLFDLSNAAIIDNTIMGNHLANNTTSSKFVIKPHATSTGVVNGNYYYVGDGATGPASLGWSTFTTTYKFGLNYCVTAVSASAIVCPAVDS
jgi:hypothetical protein